MNSTDLLSRTVLYFFTKITDIYLVGKKNIAIFASAIKTIGIFRGALVQLVRMPACHAGGHEFESRTHRFKYSENSIRDF